METKIGPKSIPFVGTILVFPSSPGAPANEFQLLHLHFTVSANCFPGLPTGSQTPHCKSPANLHSAGIDCFLFMVKAFALGLPARLHRGELVSRALNLRRPAAMAQNLFPGQRRLEHRIPMYVQVC